jgi:hypothetical protein
MTLNLVVLWILRLDASAELNKVGSCCYQESKMLDLAADGPNSCGSYSQ